MPTTYTEQQIKDLVMNQINKTKGLSSLFVSADATESFDEAVRECGFGLPASDDEFIQPKYEWLIKRMRRWYFSRLLEQYSLRFDTSDLRASQIPKNLRAVIADMDQEFADAKESDKTSHLFIDAAAFFGDDMVVTSGFLDNAYGEDVSHLGQEESSKRPKQPAATQDVIDGTY